MAELKEAVENHIVQETGGGQDECKNIFDACG